MQHIVDFILELDRLKGVTRKSKPVGLDRYENSAEHSWQIALFAASMAEFAEPGLDMQRVVAMLLVHDIGEIDTGDTIFYAEDGFPVAPIVAEGQEQGDFRKDMPAASLASVLAVGFMAPLMLPADEARNRAFLAVFG